MFLRILLISALSSGISIFCSADAHSQDAPTWELKNFKFTPLGNGIKAEFRGKPMTIEILRSKGAVDGVGDVGFICSGRILTSRVQVVPGDIYATILDNFRTAYERSGNRRRTFRPQILIDGEASKKLKWIEGKEDRLVMPLEYKSTAQLYNAAVLKSEVRLTRKKKTMILNLPKPNADFTSFGKSCLQRNTQ